MKNQKRKRSGFTLIELLVVITIITILATITLGGLSVVRKQSNIDRTQRTVQKINFLLMEKLEQYQTRRVKVDSSDTIPDIIERVGKKYDLIRMEMPDRLSDLALLTADPNTIALDKKTATTERYLRKYNSRDASNEDLTKDAPSAELLYMIIMSMPNAAEQFAEYEIGDVDGDGLREFIDAWGNPIKFLRWPVGFRPDNEAVSDLQPFDCTNIDPPNPMMYDPKYDPSDPDYRPRSAPLDPFDTFGVIKHQFPTTASFPVYPLVYSAGPDKKYDINLGWTTPPTRYNYIAIAGTDGISMLNPFEVDGQSHEVGQPLNDDDYTTNNLRHDDNITNHMLDF